MLRFKREALNALIDEINASGYALTGGAHSRIDATIDQVCSRLAAGNLYVNRNIIGAVVGVQPFGGHGLSGTGPKAGGPLYLKRLLARAPAGLARAAVRRAVQSRAEIWPKRSRRSGRRGFAELVDAAARGFAVGRRDRIEGAGRRAKRLFAGRARRRALRRRDRGSDDRADRLRAEPRATARSSEGKPAAVPVEIAARRPCAEAIEVAGPASRFEAALTDRRGDALVAFLGEIARREGPIASVFRVDAETLRRDEAPLDLLLGERSLCVNTTAAGGNASLMSIG